MTCERVAPYLSAFAAGELGHTTDLWVRAHLHGCASCAAAATTLSKATSALRRIEPDGIAPPEGFAAAVVAEVSEERHRRMLPLPLIPATSELARVSGDLIRVVQDNRETIVAAASAAAAVAGAAWLAWKAAKSLRPRPARA